MSETGTWRSVPDDDQYKRWLQIPMGERVALLFAQLPATYAMSAGAVAYQTCLPPWFAEREIARLLAQGAIVEEHERHGTFYRAAEKAPWTPTSS